MTDEEVVAAALSDPDAQPLSPEQLAEMRRVSRVKVLRQRLGMTQGAERIHARIRAVTDLLLRYPLAGAATDDPTIRRMTKTA
jgi:putative transcriptional regulator